MSGLHDPAHMPTGDAQVSIPLTRAELVAVKEAIEVTPLFVGRTEARETMRAALRTPRITPVALEGGIARQLATRIVPVDFATATARAKLQRAVRSLGRPETT
jgi:hypothetical protein